MNLIKKLKTFGRFIVSVQYYDTDGNIKSLSGYAINVYYNGVDVYIFWEIDGDLIIPCDRVIDMYVKAW